MAKTKKTENNFITDTLKKELQSIVEEFAKSNKKLTVNDIDVLTIKKTDNGYILEANDGTNEDLPSVRVLEVQEDPDIKEDETFRDGLADLLYNVATWAGFEYDPKSKKNLNIDFNVQGEEMEGVSVVDGDGGTVDESFIPPSKEEVIAAALGKAVEKIDAEVDNQYQYEDENPIVADEDLKDNEWVAGDDYGIPDEDLDDNHVDDTGYNEPLEDDDYDDSDYEDLEDED